MTSLLITNTILEKLRCLHDVLADLTAAAEADKLQPIDARFMRARLDRWNDAVSELVDLSTRLQKTN